MKIPILLTLFIFSCCSALAMGSANNNTGNLPYLADNKPYQGYYISPGPEAPLVILLHDWDGLTEYEVRRANMLVKLGYAVLVPDLFGADIRPTQTAEKQRHTAALLGNRQQMRNRIMSAIAAAKQVGANTDNAVAAGYCLGGAAVLELARLGVNLKGFVSFHGVLATPENQNFNAVKSPVLIFHGTADTAVSMDEFAKLATDLEQSGVPHQMITYGAAPHAFTVFNSGRYHPQADKDSWQRFQKFLAQQLN